MKKHKYIRKEYGFIIFPDTFNHNDFGNKSNIMSAGFCWIDTKEQKCTCVGESISLGIKSLPEDSDKMTKQFFNMW